MNRKEFKADHFKTMEELLDTIDTWLDNEELYGTLYDDFNRFFDTGAMEEMYYYIKHLQNNWNELKNIIEQDIRQCEELIEMCPKELRNTIIGTRSYEEIIGCNKHILSKMQELEGNNE